MHAASPIHAFRVIQFLCIAVLPNHFNRLTIHTTDIYCEPLWAESPERARKMPQHGVSLKRQRPSRAGGGIGMAKVHDAS